MCAALNIKHTLANECEKYYTHKWKSEQRETAAGNNDIALANDQVMIIKILIL